MALTAETLESLKYFMEQAGASITLRQHTSNSSENDSIQGSTIDHYNILEEDLGWLSKEQRLGFLITMGVFCVLSLGGNLSTLFVNSKRKMRPFFRTCLISLALSDLLSTVFLTLSNIPKFFVEYIQIWQLGSFMCRFTPLVTTAAILASSLTLVGIALDRFFAIRKAVGTFWNPGVAFCFLCALGVWLVSFGISTPLLFWCHTKSFWIWNEDSINSFLEDTMPQPTMIIDMCIVEKKTVAHYYAITFAIIFMPCIFAFIWLNSTIAKNIWVRRHPPQLQKAKKRSIALLDASSGSKTSNSKPPVTSDSTREARYIRMFSVVLILMSLFIILRLPTWIFLLMRLFGDYTTQLDWVIYFFFVLINLVSCALNPLFYTFLPETLRYISCCRRKICPKSEEREKKCLGSEACQEDVPCCICCGILCCFSAAAIDSPESLEDQQGHLSFDIDEGVVCSDVSLDEAHFELRKQEICIVYSNNLVAI